MSTSIVLHTVVIIMRVLASIKNVFEWIQSTPLSNPINKLRKKNNKNVYTSIPLD